MVGFSVFQEKAVRDRGDEKGRGTWRPGAKGGWGWAQWTGKRRRQFEAYVKEHNLDPYSR